MLRVGDRGGESLFALFLFVLTLLLSTSAAYLTFTDNLFRAVMKLGWETSLLEQRYLEELPAEKLFASCWRGMQSAIPFPVELHGVHGEPQEVSSPDFGISLLSRETQTVVYALQPGSAFIDALKPADVVTHIDENRVISESDFVALLSEAENDTIVIHFLRGGISDSAIIELHELETAALKTEWDSSIFYIAINEFQIGLARSLEEHLSSAKMENTRALIFDLRYSSGDSEAEAELCAGLVLESHGRLFDAPILLLIDETTSDASEVFASELVGHKSVTTIGQPTLGLALDREIIELRNGERLEIHSGLRSYRKRRGLDDLSVVKPDSADSAALRFESPGIQPDLRVDRRQLSPLVADIISSGLMFDFVIETEFDSLPSPLQENNLHRRFVSFLGKRGYRYDPLRDLLVSIDPGEHSEKITQVIRDMITIEETLTVNCPATAKAEILPTLLEMIDAVRFGGKAGLTDRIRMGDRFLKAAVEQVESEST